MHLNIIIDQGPDGIDNTALATIALITVLVAAVVLFRRRIQILVIFRASAFIKGLECSNSIVSGAKAARDGFGHGDEPLRKLGHGII